MRAPPLSFLPQSPARIKNLPCTPLACYWQICYTLSSDRVVLTSSHGLRNEIPKRLTVIDLCGIPLVNIQEGTPCMGSLSSLLLVSFSLHLSNFAAAIGIGMGGVDAKTRWKLALIFGFFEAAMPMVGLLIGQGLAGFIGALGHYVGAGLLVLTGMYTLWQAWRASKEQAPKAEDHQSMHFSRLTITGLALSIDNLVIGFALSFSHVPLLLAAGIIALVSVGMSLVGLELGTAKG